MAKRDAALAKERAARLEAALKEAGSAIYAQAPGSTPPYREVRVEPPTGEPRPTGAGPYGRMVADYEERR